MQRRKLRGPSLCPYSHISPLVSPGSSECGLLAPTLHAHAELSRAKQGGEMEGGGVLDLAEGLSRECVAGGKGLHHHPE